MRLLRCEALLRCCIVTTTIFTSVLYLLLLIYFLLIFSCLNILLPTQRTRSVWLLVYKNKNILLIILQTIIKYKLTFNADSLFSAGISNIKKIYTIWLYVHIQYTNLVICPYSIYKCPYSIHIYCFEKHETVEILSLAIWLAFGTN